MYELQYFTHLVEEHEIKDKFALDHYSPDIRRVLFLGEETAFHFGKRLGPNQLIAGDQRTDLEQFLGKYDKIIRALDQYWIVELPALL
jgi:hypothetical protein